MRYSQATWIIRCTAALLLIISIALISGCDAPEWSIVSPKGASGKSFSNSDLRISFKLVHIWLRMEIENLSSDAISWHWPKDSFTRPDGTTYTVAYIEGFSSKAGRYEAGTLDGFVPTIKSSIRTGNATSIIPAGQTLYNYVCLTVSPNESQYYQEHAYEDKETVDKRRKELLEKYGSAYHGPIDPSANKHSDSYLDFIPRLPGKKAYGEYSWKAKYYVGVEQKGIELLFLVTEKPVS